MDLSTMLSLYNTHTCTLLLYRIPGLLHKFQVVRCIVVFVLQTM